MRGTAFGRLTLALLLALVVSACGGAEEAPSSDEAPAAAATDDGGAAEAADGTEQPAEPGGAEETAAEAPEGGSGQLEVVGIALPALSAVHWDVHVGAAEGIFEDHGIDLQITMAPGPAATIAALSGSSVDVGIAFGDQTIAAMALGAPIKCIAGENGIVAGEVIGRQDITGMEDLRGQKLVSSNVDDILTLYMKDALAAEGLAPGEYDLLIQGSSEQRYQSLQTGAVAAATMTAPRSFQAIAEGYPKLVEIFEPGLMSCHTANDTFTSERPEVAQAYVDAIVEAQNWLVDPANRDRAVEILVERVEVTQEIAEQTYDLYVGKGIFQAGAPLDEELVVQTLELLKENGKVFDEQLDPNEYVDYQFLEAAQQS